MKIIVGDKFGSELKKCRVKLLLTQDGFAKEVGTSVANVKSWETGRQMPNFENWEKICTYIET